MMKVVEHPITRFHLIKPNSDESETIPYREGGRGRERDSGNANHSKIVIVDLTATYYSVNFFRCQQPYSQHITFNIRKQSL